MTAAIVSLAALVFAIVLSCVSHVNVGFVAILLASAVGVLVAGMSLGEVVAGFPAPLFLTLVGVTLLFSQARTNAMLERAAQHAVALCRGKRALIPILFFLVAVLLSSAGPGNIAAAVLVAPVAMSAASRERIPAFLMAIMVGTGASAGSLSPLAPAGIVANEIMAKAGLTDVALWNYLNNLLVHCVVAAGGYVLFGGRRLLATGAGAERQMLPSMGPAGAPLVVRPEPFERAHVVPLLVIGGLMVGVILFRVNVGMGAFAGALVLTTFKMADEERAIAEIPWRVIMMVCGVTVLIAVLEKTGGLDLLASMVARISTERTVTGVAAFFTGAISLYSSTSGVVLPALLPTVPRLIEQLGGGDALAIASAINVGGHLVDVSPLSTIGAICLASAPRDEDSRTLFNKLMAWGLTMVVVGALICWVCFGVLRLP